MIELIEKVAPASSQETLVLPYADRQKSRLRTQLCSGREAAVMLAPGSTLEDGDCLRADDGTLVSIRAAEEALSTARTSDRLLLARACYHLGNRHVTLQVGEAWVRYQPDHVLDEMVRRLGLEVSVEHAPFAPERGAYHQPHGGHHH